MFRVETSSGAKSAQVECTDWLGKQNVDMYEAYNLNSSCPQTIFQMWWDPA